MQGDKFEDRSRFGADRDPLRLYRFWQLRHRVLHPVLDLDLVHIRVAADLEADGQDIGAVVSARRLHVDHSGDAIDLQLDRQRDGVDDGLRACARIAGHHLYRRWRHIGVLSDRQSQQRDQPEKHDYDRQDIGENRMLDKEFRNHCCAPGLADPVTASIVVGCGTTLVPGVARHKSPTTTRSSGCRPEVTTRSPPINDPN